MCPYSWSNSNWSLKEQQKERRKCSEEERKTKCVEVERNLAWLKLTWWKLSTNLEWRDLYSSLQDALSQEWFRETRWDSKEICSRWHSWMNQREWQWKFCLLLGVINKSGFAEKLHRYSSTKISWETNFCLMRGKQKVL